MTINVIVAGSEDRQLERLIQSCGGQVRAIPLTELAGLAHPTAHQPDVLVVDLRDERTVPPALGILKREHPTTGVVIVAASLDPSLMLEAMRAGVTECVTNPVSLEDLQAAIDRVVERQQAPKTGQVLAFVGAKGGIGTTTAAVNVATALAKISSLTLVIDLHLAYGDASVFLGTEARFSIVDALENTHRLDEAFFRGLVAKTKAGLDLLASSTRTMVGPADGDRIKSLIDFVARHYRYTVLDVPRSDSTVLDSLDSASTIVVVANQELATVRSASRMAAALRQRYGREKVMVIMSRFDHLSEIGAADIERVVGLPVKYTIPSDYRLALQALNKGRPVTLDNHTKLAASYQSMAQDVAGVEGEKPSTTRQSRLLDKLRGRRQ